MDEIPASSLGHDFTRNILPWSNDPLDDNSSPVDSSVKEERMRMLEREFGAQSKYSPSDERDLDENGNPRIGSVDKDGNLVTQGPIKRIVIRVLQIVLALTAGVPSIYAALVSPCQMYTNKCSQSHRHPRLLNPTELLLRLEGRLRLFYTSSPSLR